MILAFQAKMPKKHDAFVRPTKKPPPRFVCEHSDAVIKGFLARLYAFATLQCAFIALCVQWATVNSSTLLEIAPARDSGSIAVRANFWVLAVSVLVAAVTLGMMVLFPAFTYMFPVNMALLVVYSLSLAYNIASFGPDSRFRMLVLHVLWISLLIMVLLLIYCLLPWGGYSFIAASLFSLLVLVLVGAAVLLLDPEEYAWNWKWLDDDSAWNDAGAAYTASGLWLSLLGCLFFSFYLQWCLRESCQTHEPWDYVASAFRFNTNVVMSLIVLITGVATVVTNATTALSTVVNARIRLRAV